LKSGFTNAVELQTTAVISYFASRTSADQSFGPRFFSFVGEDLSERSFWWNPSQERWALWSSPVHWKKSYSERL